MSAFIPPTIMYPLSPLLSPGVWLRSMASDYKDACREIFVSARKQPIKASVYVALLSGAWASFQTKPDRSSFETALLECSGQLGLLSPWIRNPTSDGHVQSLAKLRNEGRLRHVSLGLFSLVFRYDFDPDVALYEARCSNVSVPWKELPERMLDVGFAGRWWILDSKMKEYDVNDEEFRRLPVHMQVTSPPGAAEVERSERLHRESWLAVKMEEDAVDIRGQQSVGKDGTVQQQDAAA